MIIGINIPDCVEGQYEGVPLSGTLIAIVLEGCSSEGGVVGSHCRVHDSSIKGLPEYCTVLDVCNGIM